MSMSRQGRADRFDRLLEAILADPRTPLSTANSEELQLLRVASDLRNLPSPAFRARLGADLSRRAMTMTTGTRSLTRQDVQTLTVYLPVWPAVELIEFVKRAFSAEELFRTTGSEGGLHAEVKIGDAKLMIGGGEPWHGTPMPTALHLYVADADDTYRRALEAGATSLRPPVDQPYGDREASVSDLAGNHWYIATHQLGRHIPSGLRSVTPAKIRVGNSVLELSDAHAEFGPRPTMFYLYVDDVDVSYQRALSAGATSREQPTRQPYGERRAAVRDPFENEWYLAAPAK